MAATCAGVWISSSVASSQRDGSHTSSRSQTRASFSRPTIARSRSARSGCRGPVSCRRNASEYATPVRRCALARCALRVRSGAIQRATRNAELLRRTACRSWREPRHWLHGGPLALGLSRRLLRRFDRRAALHWRLTAKYALEIVTVERLVLDQRRRDSIQHVAMVGDDLDCLLIALVDEPSNLLVDGLGRLLRVVLLLADLSAKEDEFLLVPQGDCAEPLAHAVLL